MDFVCNTKNSLQKTVKPPRPKKQMLTIEKFKCLRCYQMLVNAVKCTRSESELFVIDRQLLTMLMEMCHSSTFDSLKC